MFADLRATAVYAAAKRIHSHLVRTPLRRSAALSAIAGGDVFLKLETEQVTGSFKPRGAFNAIAALGDETRRRGVVASSAGNHGLGVAFAAKHFGVPATVFVPRTAPDVKKRGIAALGATVDDSQPDYDAAMTAAIAHAAERGKTFVNPCLGDDLLAGQGTVALEILEELPELASVVLPVGGGGLLGGTAMLLRRVAPHVSIIGAQSEETAAMSRSLAAGRVVEIPSVPTLADGLAGQIDDAALDIGRHGLDEIVTLSEERIGATIAWLARTEELVVEGAGSVAVGAVLERLSSRLTTPAAIVVSGRNIDPEKHARALSAER
ncbi:MAG TPA: pyridoxal-phosphate dependent enzyme [Gemmatimonadaceae bacterium]